MKRLAYIGFVMSAGYAAVALYLMLKIQSTSAYCFGGLLLLVSVGTVVASCLVLNRRVSTPATVAKDIYDLDRS